MDYKASGVDYSLMDPFKRLCQQAGANTARLTDVEFLDEVEWTRGESVHVLYNQLSDLYEGHVHEGLGTKNLVADAIGDELGWQFYQNIAQDTLAMGLNDAATLGIRPTRTFMHLAVGSGDWFLNLERQVHLVTGWAAASVAAGCMWAGGETPTLKGIIEPGASELSCSVSGYATRSGLIKRDVQVGDRIWLFASSGIHANGLTLARNIGNELPDGYLTKLPNSDLTYAEHLLQPTVLYGPLVEACQDLGAEIHYCVNITGHGWRKLMRLEMPFDYVIKRILEPQPVFKFIQEHEGLDDRSMYGDFNMGVGWAMYLPEEDGQIVEECAAELGIDCIDAGYVAVPMGEEEGARVIIEPKGLVFGRSELQVR